MEITGTLKVKGSTEQVSEKFKKREFVITTEGEYPQHISLQLVQDKTSLLDAYKVGDLLLCHINLRGKMYEKDGKTKYFNSIEAWKIEKLGTGTGEPESQHKEKGIDADDSLPF